MGIQTSKYFLWLVCIQAAHSLEEWIMELWVVFAPARLVAVMVIESNPSLGFALANVAVVSFGAWCFWARVRPMRGCVRCWIGLWAVLELINGLGHSLMAITRGGYFPGVITAPLLFVVAVLLLKESRVLSRP